jgi:hypothetical protein
MRLLAGDAIAYVFLLVIGVVLVVMGNNPGHLGGVVLLAVVVVKLFKAARKRFANPSL